MPAKKKAVAKAKRGRPPIPKRDDIIATICAAVADGALVKDSCAAQGVSPAQFRAWVADVPELSALYARAREEQAHALAEQCIMIADGLDEEAQERLEAMVEKAAGEEEDFDKEQVLSALANSAIQRDKLRLDARKWLVSKIAPRNYGDRVHQEHSGAISLEALVSDSRK